MEWTTAAETPSKKKSKLGCFKHTSIQSGSEEDIKNQYLVSQVVVSLFDAQICTNNHYLCISFNLNCNLCFPQLHKSDI